MMKSMASSNNRMKIQRLIVLCIFIMNIIVVGAAGAVGADRDVIIGFKNTVGHSEKALVEEHGYIKKSFNLIHAVSARIRDDNISDIQKDPRVEYIEDESVFTAADASDINEYQSTWGAGYIGSDLPVAKNINGSSIKIAILDSGIDCTHPDLLNNCYSGYNFYSNNTNTFDDHIYSHGTHVSGIIGAEKNGMGVIGVAPNASLYAVKVLGTYFGGTSYVIMGIEWAVEHNMDIITMSLSQDSSHPPSQALKDAVDAAYANGILVIAAAGNNPNGTVTYPAAYDNVIAVTAIDSNDNKASFSPKDSKIELSAPGVGINSTIVGGYGYLSGTSQAAPYVAGVAALIMSKRYQDINGDNKFDNKDVRIILDDTARDIGDSGKDDIYGYGVVDASNATLNIPSKITLLRNLNSPVDDQQAVNLSKGNYTITLHSDSLEAVQVKNGRDVSTHNFSRGHDINIQVNLDNDTEFVFIPLGAKASSGYVRIASFE